jgi:hypothetical protein
MTRIAQAPTARLTAETLPIETSQPQGHEPGPAPDTFEHQASPVTIGRQGHAAPGSEAPQPGGPTVRTLLSLRCGEAPLDERSAAAQSAQANLPPKPPSDTASAGAPGGPPEGPHQVTDDSPAGQSRPAEGLHAEIASQGALERFDDHVRQTFPEHEVMRDPGALAWKLIRDEPVDALKVDIEGGQVRLHSLDGPQPGWTTESTSLPAPRDEDALDLQSMLQVFSARLGGLRRRFDRRSLPSGRDRNAELTRVADRPGGAPGTTGARGQHQDVL